MYPLAVCTILSSGDVVFGSARSLAGAKKRTGRTPAQSRSCANLDSWATIEWLLTSLFLGLILSCLHRFARAFSHESNFFFVVGRQAGETTESLSQQQELSEELFLLLQSLKYHSMAGKSSDEFLNWRFSFSGMTVASAFASSRRLFLRSFSYGDSFTMIGDLFSNIIVSSSASVAGNAACTCRCSTLLVILAELCEGVEM